MKKLRSAVAAGALVALGSTAAHATLIRVQPEDALTTGNGLGSVATVLTLQSQGNATVETGSVAPGAGGTSVVTGDAQAQNRVQSFASVGLTSPESLRVTFNPQEPNTTAQGGITLTNLQVSLFGANGGAPLFTSDRFTSPVTFSAAEVGSQTGVGRAGFVFRLSDDDVAEARQSGAFTGGNVSANLIGLTASASDAQGGLDTFFITVRTFAPGAGGGGAGGGTGAVPLPGTIALLGAGFLVLGLRRKQSR